ncbi:FxLD family lantipeptide [Actinoalloteichus hoggarensis]|uniref:Uncharacterized protein n=1 Tax=Actinoalloteichus hoggarensis TaxID=1470176 RepID=A0A221WB79_9PSEU|nr:hypothetical protein AHOG_27435 [Actinoalloteichus hoggarensis]MBB5922690.1 FxLD family lantipeptide [Actinoalloteichus hoggarensis]
MEIDGDHPTAFDDFDLDLSFAPKGTAIAALMNTTSDPCVHSGPTRCGGVHRSRIARAMVLACRAARSDRS